MSVVLQREFMEWSFIMSGDGTIYVIMSDYHNEVHVNNEVFV